MKTQLRIDPPGVEIMEDVPHKLMNHDASVASAGDDEDDCYSAALPSDASSSGYESLEEGFASPRAFKLKEELADTTPSTSTTEPFSDVESLRLPGPPLSVADSERTSRTSMDNAEADSDSSSPKQTKRKSKKSTKSKKKKSNKNKIDYSGLSLMALKLELEVCGVSMDGLEGKEDYVKALEDFKKAEAKKENKSKKKKTPAASAPSSSKFTRSQSLGQIETPSKREERKKIKYAENDKVLYVSSNGDSESATILKVHLDDELVPFYDIRLDVSGREKQTDDAHLSAALAQVSSPSSSSSPPKVVVERKRPSSKSSINNKTENNKPPMRRSSTTSLRSSTGSSRPMRPKTKKFAADDKVLYVSSNGEKESATILKVHLDDDQVPFYDIRLHSSGREKQTDDAHLTPLLAAVTTATEQRKRPSRKVSASSQKPMRHNSMGTLSGSRASSAYSFTSDQLNTPKKTAPPQRRSSLTFGNLPDGFVSPFGKKSSADKPKKNKSMSKFEQQQNKIGSLNLAEVSPARKRSSRGAVPRRIKSLSVQSSSSKLAAPMSNKSPTRKSGSGRSSSGSTLPRLDLSSSGGMTSPSAAKSKQRLSKSNRRASLDGSGNIADYRAISPKSPGTRLSKAKKLMVKAS